MTMLASRRIRPTSPELGMSMLDDTHAAWRRALLGSRLLPCVLFPPRAVHPRARAWAPSPRLRGGRAGWGAGPPRRSGGRWTPTHLGKLIGIGKLGAQAPSRDDCSACLAQEPVGVLPGVARHAARGAGVGPAGHEEELVLHWVRQPELDIRCPDLFQTVQGISHSTGLLQGVRERAEIEPRELRD